MPDKNESIDLTDIKGPTKTLIEDKTKRLIDLTLAAPNCVAVIRSPDGIIEEKFEFSIDQFGRKQGFMLGFNNWFSVMDISGNKRKYKLAEHEI